MIKKTRTGDYLMMTPVREAQKQYCSRALIFAIGMGFSFYLIGLTALMKGLILGTLFSIVNFILIGETLPYRLRLKNNKKRLFWVSLGSVVCRFFLLAVPMALALKSETYNLWTTVAGLFIVQILILLNPIIENLSIRLKRK